MGDKCGKQVWETGVGDKCKIMRSKTPRVGDMCGGQVEDKCKLMRPEAPKCEGQMGDKRKMMRPKALGRQVRETSGRQL